jgi:hypothetical protein
MIIMSETPKINTEYNSENLESFLNNFYKDPSEKYVALFESMHNLCKENGWGEPFSYARSREIHMACILGNTLADTYSGADAYDEDGPCEYKSTISNKINATYNGISVQPSWDEQIKYLKEEKIGKYKNHYYARYNGSSIEEIWKLTADDVISIVEEPLKKQYHNKSNKKDPRLGINISEGKIKQYGKRIL